MIGAFLDNLPALVLGMTRADAELVGDGSVAQIVGRIAGIDRNLYNALSCDIQERGCGVPSFAPRTPRRGRAGEQADQLDQARVRTAAISDTRDVKLGPVDR